MSKRSQNTMNILMIASSPLKNCGGVKNPIENISWLQSEYLKIQNNSDHASIGYQASNTTLIDRLNRRMTVR
jgi:hypothetical protein